MIFPRTTALEASAHVESALRDKVGRMAPAGDLRMGKETLSRIVYVVEKCTPEDVAAALVAAGWRKLRTSRGPMVFARDRWPKLVICVAHEGHGDLLGVNRHSNFEVLLFLLTGTAMFQHRVREFIRQNGFTFRTERGLYHGDTLVAWLEEDIFLSAGLTYIPPEERYIFHPEKYQALVEAF